MQSSNADLPARWIRIQYCHALETFSLCRLKGDTWERKIEQILSCLLTWIQMELSWTAPMNENVYTNISLGFVIVLSFCFPVSRCISTARCDCIYMTTLMVWLVPCKEVAKVDEAKKFEEDVSKYQKYDSSMMKLRTSDHPMLRV